MRISDWSSDVCSSDLWHIVAGTSYVRGDGFHLNPEHPPLVKLWVGAAMPGDFRLRPRKALAAKAQEREWVEQRMFFDNDPLATQDGGRAAMWSFSEIGRGQPELQSLMRRQ